MNYTHCRFLPSLFIIITTISSLTPINSYTSESDTKSVVFKLIGTPVSAVLDQNNKPTATLIELMKATGIETTDNPDLETVVTLTQKAWLRPAGKERWEIEKKFENQRDSLIPLLEKLGYVHEIKPSSQTYTHALILGGLISNTRQRFAHLIKLFNEGIRFEHLYFLGGARPLEKSEQEKISDPSNPLSIKKEWILYTMPTTETEMMKMVYEQADLPAQLHEIPVTFIDVPMQETSNGTLRRPNTADTVLWFCQSNPKPGNCLTISNQPYIHYQEAIMNAHLTDQYRAETVGSTAASECPIVLYLDSMARQLWELKKIKTSHGEK